MHLPPPQRRMSLCLTTSSNEITHDKTSSLAATLVLSSFMVTSLTAAFLKEARGALRSQPATTLSPLVFCSWWIPSQMRSWLSQKTLPLGLSSALLLAKRNCSLF